MVPHKSLEVLAVATAFGLLLGAHPAAALVCQDPESGTTRESGTDSCELGERQILPEVPAPAPARAAPAGDRAPSSASTWATAGPYRPSSSARLGVIAGPSSSAA